MTIFIWTLQGLLAAMFLMAAVGKLTGSSMQRGVFEHLRLPQWFRGVTGLVELTGAALLVIGYWQENVISAGALILGITAIGGMLAHIRVKDGFKDTIMIVVLGILSFILLYLVR
ncbi:DoxX family protein [Bacillus sp. BHET2]|uniref:DoxX family protein n=1 Tax=Bacillus sp. BHET2 TaxID=2583818 RepID=UPI00110E7FC4|nr:DoxX family protein [Bacillus sp. BHET2]TMU87520.1 DoxX family protein [Bacillus sp. BHET2]